MQVIDKTLQNERYFILNYGASGSGKTHLIATLGELGRVLVIDVDQGYKTILTGKGITKAMQDNILIVTFDSFQDLDSAYKLMYANDPKLWNKEFNSYWKVNSNGTKTWVTKPESKWVTYVTEPFDWGVWDTWSELQWHMSQKLRKDKKLLSPNDTLDFRDNLQIQHWGSLTDLNKLAVEAMREITKTGIMSIVFTMQEKVDKDEISGTIVKGPAIHGKMVAEMPSYFDVVVHTGTTPAGAWTATTKPKMGWPAKTRLGEGVELVNPTMKQILNI